MRKSYFKKHVSRIRVQILADNRWSLFGLLLLFALFLLFAAKAQALPTEEEARKAYLSNKCRTRTGSTTSPSYEACMGNNGSVPAASRSAPPQQDTRSSVGQNQANSQSEEAVANENDNHPQATTEAEAAAQTMSETRQPGNTQQGTQTSQSEPYETMNEDDLAIELDKLENACHAQEQKAEECCTQPDRCFATSPDGDPNTQNGTAGQIMQMLMGTAAQIPTSSITQMCSRMGTLGKASTAINTYLAGRCTMQIRQCKSACGDALEQFRQEQSWGESSCSTNEERELNPGCARYAKVVRRYGSEVEKCDQLEDLAAQMGNQAIASHMSSRYADLCKEQASSGNENPFGNQDPFTADCSGAQASTPFCQNGCNRPNAANDPTCKAIADQLAGGNGMGSGGTDAFNKDFKDMFGNVPGDDEGTQNPLYSDTAANNKTANVEGGGGGGGLGGGGDGGDSGSGPGGGGAASGGGYDTDIFAGQRTGGGYSSSGGGYKSGSSSSAPTGEGKNIFGSLFNLNKYLPGGKKAAGLSVGRDIASVRKDVGPAFGNIFKNISDRFYQVCLRDALHDCSTLKKLKGGR